jgi:catechol 2,3-dioxygenase-like lactoylglutathione lyase family enzyme
VTHAPAPSLTHLSTVGVPVRDQDRALAFYTGVLGLELRREAPLPAGRWLEVAPAGATTTIALVADEQRAGADTGIRLASTDVAASHTALRAAGVDVEDVLRWPGVPPMCVLRDPDGNRLTLVETA